MSASKIVLVNFANGAFYEKKRKLQTLTAKYIAQFDRIDEYSIEDIDKSFYEKNKSIFEEKKGI